MFILASTSVTRGRLLDEAGVVYTALASGVDEESAKAAFEAEGLGPRSMADALAELKARAGWARAGQTTVGCDQTLELEGSLLSKPMTQQDLRNQLTLLRGKTHRLHSALVLVEDGTPTWRETTTSTLAMRRFTDDFLDDYMAREGDQLLGSVGGYHLEGRGVQLFDRVDGDYFAILGLPLLGLLQALRLRGLAPS
jgi:septum formation protein